MYSVACSTTYLSALSVNGECRCTSLSVNGGVCMIMKWEVVKKLCSVLHVMEDDPPKCNHTRDTGHKALMPRVTLRPIETELSRVVSFTIGTGYVDS